MSKEFEFYPRSTDNLQSQTCTPDDLPLPPSKTITAPEGYIADAGLADAFNVSLLLGQPLLLTGEPGVGKTQFAYSAMYRLGFSKLISIIVKSDTKATDFLYTVDDLRRFRDAQLQGHHNRGNSLVNSDNQLNKNYNFDTDNDQLHIKNYLRWGPLGEAIIRANPPGTYANLPNVNGHERQERSIVLIDEIDKAPRDIPNDLLHEFDRMEFTIPELNLTIAADPKYSPVLILTSNSERNLPEAFLRRCVYYNIPFPGEEEQLYSHEQYSKEYADNSADNYKELMAIINSRLSLNESDKIWLFTALKIFMEFRSPHSGLEKRPGTSELLNWLIVLQNKASNTNREHFPDLSTFNQTKGILFKNKSDIKTATDIYHRYTLRR